MIHADALTVSHVTGELIHVLVEKPPGGPVGVPQPVLDPVAFFHTGGGQEAVELVAVVLLIVDAAGASAGDGVEPGLEIGFKRNDTKSLRFLEY